MKGIKINHTTKIITITKAFESALNNPYSPETEALARIQKDFPALKVNRKSSRSTAKCNSAKGLTYANMERYINVFQNAAELLERFAEVRELAAAQTNSYLYVKRWFIAQFPNYKEIPDFATINLIPTVCPVPSMQSENRVA